MVQREQRGAQPDDATAGDEDVTVADAVAERLDALAAQLGGGMEQAVGADRSHLGEQDPEDRVEVAGHGHGEVVRPEDVARAVSVGGGDQVAHGEVVAAALDDLGDLHVAHGDDRVAP